MGPLKAAQSLKKVVLPGFPLGYWWSLPELVLIPVLKNGTQLHVGLIGPHLQHYTETLYLCSIIQKCCILGLWKGRLTEENPQQLWFWPGQCVNAATAWRVESSAAELDFLGLCRCAWLVGSLIHWSQSIQSYHLPVHPARWQVTSLPVKNCYLRLLGRHDVIGQGISNVPKSFPPTPNKVVFSKQVFFYCNWWSWVLDK